MTDTPREPWSAWARLRHRTLAGFDRLVNRAAVIVGLAGVLLAINSNAEATKNREAIESFTETVYARCLQRQAQDESTLDGFRADVQLFLRSLEIQDQVPLPEDPHLRKLTIEYREAITIALTQKRAAVTKGVIGKCEIYKTAQTR